MLTTPPTPVKPADRRQWTNLPGAAESLAIASAARQAASVSLVITRDTHSAMRMHDELAFFLGGTLPILQFPDWETLIYDSFSPHQDIISERLATLNRLPSLKRCILVVPATTLVQKVAPRQFVLGSSLTLAEGQKFNIDAMRKQLMAAAYRSVETVYEHGEYAVRGSIMDIFPMGSDAPLRVDLLDDEIDTLRTFEPETQRSIDRVSSISLLPAREFPLTEDAVRHFQDEWFTRFPNAGRDCTIYRDLARGLSPAGIEYYMPLFFEKLETLLDYLPEDTLLFCDDIEPSLDQFWQDATSRHENLRHDLQRPILPPGELLLTSSELFSTLKQYPRIDYHQTTFIPTSQPAPVPTSQPAPVPASQPAPVPASQPAPASASQPAPVPASQPAPAPASQPAPIPTFQPAPSSQQFAQESVQGSVQKRGETTFDFRQLPDVTVADRNAAPLAALKQFVETSGNRVLIAAESNGRREVVDELLAANGMRTDHIESWQAFLQGTSPLGLAVAPIERGLLTNAATSVALITEQQLFGERVLQKRRRDREREVVNEMTIKSLTELHPGSPVVHLDHGVGRYQGLQTLSVDGQDNEFLTLVYQDDAKLYVPVASLHLISRHAGSEEESAPLHRLGGETWEKAKREAAEQINDVAAELLDIYARRKAKKGFTYPKPDANYHQFCAAFPFEETPDQESAIEKVISDMTQEEAMDRLICGDVGFGKTEVAMRAAFLAVQSGKQVAVLVPTTLLARQHAETFRDRFADWPVQIDSISRFKTKKEQLAVTERMKSGQIDIVIGTHALIQDGLTFKDLGLLIIDEEHRFGVRQKEKLKSLRAEVDILTLTATPIPRTLNMALSGLRDLSIIATPPAKRLSIKTFVRQHNEGLIREAVQREIMRGGQVYYLHNEVRTIDRTADRLQELLPQASIATGHGQMRERELEQVMQNFYHQRTSVLVCTTIIETGIDIPNANTIIIDRADKLGLAQIHQLRGRVGRSHHQAYAYLLTPHPKALTRDAVKRLDAIAEAEDLGAGFILATHDLEIRGAGELLGDEQTGNMHTLGFSLYMDMLDRAVKAIRDGKTPNLDRPLKGGIEVNLHLPALIPENYLSDVHARLVLYKRIASAETEEQLRELQVEMIDRFGLLPEPCKNLFRVTGLKLRADRLGIRKLDADQDGGKLEFGAETSIEPGIIVALVQGEPELYRLTNANQLAFDTRMEKHEHRFQEVEKLLARLETGQDGEGKNETGQDGKDQDGAGQDGKGQDGARQDGESQDGESQDREGQDAA